MIRVYQTRQRGRDSGGHDLTYTEAVDFDRRVVAWRVCGRLGSERVERQGVRQCPEAWSGSVEYTDLHRSAGGWTLIEVRQ